jgi:hypothetical protein
MLKIVSSRKILYRASARTFFPEYPGSSGLHQNPDPGGDPPECLNEERKGRSNDPSSAQGNHARAARRRPWRPARRAVLDPCPPSPHPVQTPKPWASSPRSARRRRWPRALSTACCQRACLPARAAGGPVRTHPQAHAPAHACPLLDEVGTGQNARCEHRARNDHGGQHVCVVVCEVSKSMCEVRCQNQIVHLAGCI